MTFEELCMMNPDVLEEFIDENWKAPKSMSLGWICPRCDTANSPAVTSCACSPHTSNRHPPNKIIEVS